MKNHAAIFASELLERFKVRTIQTLLAPVRKASEECVGNAPNTKERLTFLNSRYIIGVHIFTMRCAEQKKEFIRQPEILKEGFTKYWLQTILAFLVRIRTALC